VRHTFFPVAELRRRDAFSFCVVVARSLRKAIQQNQFTPNQNNRRAIHSQRFNGCSPGLSSTAKPPSSCEGEMIGPKIRTGIEQRNRVAGSGIGGRCSSGFAKGTRDTSQRQILQLGWPVLGSGQHVVNVERGFLRCLRQNAVLADIARPFSNEFHQTHGDLGTHC